MAGAPKEAYIVSHTHWDREWYLSYQRFRVKLIDVVQATLEALEEAEDFKHFILDGQSIILEDYLEIRPQDAERIRRLVESRRLAIGPWYILPDEFLVSAEATVRNLLYGHKVGAPFGGVQRVGYMPDSFGHLAQLPQILRHAGIDSFIYTRGNGPEIEDLGLEYFWRAPDSSEVLAINQCGGYCNAAGLGFQELWQANTQRDVDLDRAVEQVRELFARLSESSNGEIYLLNNGCDHHFPQRQLGPIMAALSKAFPLTTFKHARFEDYLEAIRAEDRVDRYHTGELAQGMLQHILSGVWSTRIYLKQQNDRAQTLLADLLEPAAAYAHFCLGQPYPHGLIESVWKRLLKNHPHDSICGCSIDEVHREMEVRFAALLDSGDQILRDLLQRMLPSFARHAAGDRDTAICVFNPLPEKRSEIVERLVVLQPCCADLEQLRLLDRKGAPVPFETVSLRHVERFWGIDYRTELQAESQTKLFQSYLDHFAERILGGPQERDRFDRFLKIRFLAQELPALGHTTYYLTDRASAAAVVELSEPVRVSAARLENEYLELRLHADGSFDLLDKQSGSSYSGLNRLEDTEDVGDEYDYSPAVHSQTVFSDTSTGVVRVLEQGGLQGMLEAEYALMLPRAISADRRQRDSQLVECAVRTRVSLKQGSKHVEVELTFANRAEDHRLRAWFPTPLVTESVTSDGHFYLNRRPIEQPQGRNWVQPPAGPYPQQDYSLLHDGRHGLALLNRGLPEIEATRDDTGCATLRLTLLRCVGWLSRDDFPTRRHSGAGPTLHTPGAQCRGEHRFEYALLPFTGDPLAAGITAINRRYRAPVLTLQGVEEGHIPGGSGLFSKRSELTRVSAIKRHEIRSTLMIRLYNLAPEPIEELLSFELKLLAAWRTDLLEARLAPLALRDPNHLAVVLGAHEIVTLEVEVAARDALPSTA